MMTAMLTIKNTIAGEQLYDIWNVNEGAEYHEAGVSGARGRPSQARVSCRDEWREAAMAITVRPRPAWTREGGLSATLSLKLLGYPGRGEKIRRGDFPNVRPTGERLFANSPDRVSCLRLGPAVSGHYPRPPALYRPRGCRSGLYHVSAAI